MPSRHHAQPASPGAKPVFAGKSAAALLTLSKTASALGLDGVAIDALQAALRLEADFGPAWGALGRLLMDGGDTQGAQVAAQRAASLPPGAAMQSASPPTAERLAEAERRIASLLRRAGTQPPGSVLHAHLLAQPEDAAGLRILASAMVQQGDATRAMTLLARALEIAPAYTAARQDLVAVQLACQKWPEALANLDQLAEAVPQGGPDQERVALQRAAALAQLGKAGEAIAIYEALIARGGLTQPQFRLRYATLLRTAGRAADGARVLRDCIARDPSLGAAYWGLADLKADPLTAADIDAMQAQLRGPALSADSRSHFHYALGHALEKRGDFEASFRNYDAGAKLRQAIVARQGIAYQPDELTARAQRNRAYYTATRLAARAGFGCADSAPIFIIGMPRSGSTLIEQILASHSQVEGLQELPEIDRLINKIRSGSDAASRYPLCLDRFSAAEFAAMGQRYVDACAAYRKTGRPFFIDKMPANWLNIGFIHAILPRAKIIDARRHPMAAGLGAFKQLIVGGGNYTYSLTHIGQRYRDYVELMAYFDTVLPGRIHRVIYEDMVEDTEAQIRALLAYCGLPFESQCLRFWETERSVRTPSASQVRRPINRDGLAQWRGFEPWLGELRAALGPALADWRGAAR